MKALASILCLLVSSSVYAEDAHPLSGGAEIHWQQFTGMIKEAKKVVVYFGTPRRRDRDPKPHEPTIEIDDYEFYRDAHNVTPEMAVKLARLVSDPHSFYDYGGMKLCGGFHPDVCIEWRYEQDGQHWHQRAFACLGCDEWRLVSTVSAVHTDMAKEAADELIRILHDIRGNTKTK